MEGIINQSIDKKLENGESKENSLFEKSLNNFLQENYLDLDIPKRVENIEMLQKSQNKETVGDFTIANDFTLATEGSRLVLSYKNDSDKILVVKITKEETMNNLNHLNDWGDGTVEEYLKEHGFNNPNVLLPIDTIKENENVYRFYEAMDIDLEKYLETNNQFSINEGISLMMRAYEGVRALNEIGVSNIDLAPLNIMLTKNSLKVIDLDGASIDKNSSGIFKRNYLGNNRFASAPELFEERPVFDKTVDIYASSTCLFRLVTGDWPYNIEKKTRNLPYEEKMAAFKKEHESGNILFPDYLPSEFKEIIKKGMNPIPKNRYQSMNEFMSDLINFYNSQKEHNKNIKLEDNLKNNDILKEEDKEVE
jgi:serine/threonine protein kinase